VLSFFWALLINYVIVFYLASKLRATLLRGAEDETCGRAYGRQASRVTPATAWNRRKKSFITRAARDRAPDYLEMCISGASACIDSGARILHPHHFDTCICSRCQHLYCAERTQSR
jgi:hypothetical protein